MMNLAQDTNLTTIEAIKAISDTITVSVINASSISDTLNVMDVSNNYDNLLSIVAIGIALSSIIVPQIIKWRREVKERRDLKQYILFFATQLIDTINVKISQVNGLAQKISDIDSKEFEYKASLTYRASNLLKIPQDELFRIFVPQKEPGYKEDFRNYKELFDAIAFFVTHDIHAELNFSQFMLDVRLYDDNFWISMNEIYQIHDHYNLELHKKGEKPSEDKFLSEIDEIGNEYQQSGNMTAHSVAVEKFVKPLQDVVHKFMLDKRALKILKPINKCESAHLHLRNTKKLYSSVFKNMAGTLEQKRDSLTAAIEYFEKK